MHDRDGLIDLMERYLDALIAHDPAAIDVTANVKVTENGVAMKFGEGLFQTAQSIQFRQFFADPSAQQVGFFGTLATSDGPAMLALRLKLDDGVVSEAEAIVPRQGGHALFAPDALVEPMPIYDMLLSAAEPAPRDELLAIANRYFDAIEQADGQVAPFHPECNRRENGVQTTNNPGRNFPLGCEEGINSLTYIPRVRDRRFPVVDEERGLVWAFVMFDMPSQNRSMRLSELFKIVDGGIREIEALMINTPLDASTGWNE